MDQRIGLSGVPAEGLGRWAQLSEKIGDGIRAALGTVLFQPDGYLYPHDVKEKAGEILGIVPTLGHISVATAAQRAGIVNGYEPRQVTRLVRDSEEMLWTSKPGFYFALARRVVREAGEVDFMASSSRPHSGNRPQQPPQKNPCNRAKPRFTVVRNDD